jgi:hypothetical protein
VSSQTILAGKIRYIERVSRFASGPAVSCLHLSGTWQPRMHRILRAHTACRFRLLYINAIGIVESALLSRLRPCCGLQHPDGCGGTFAVQKMKQAKQKLNMEHRRLLMAYHDVVDSVREARTMQGVLEKDRQIRRLMRYLNQANQM